MAAASAIGITLFFLFLGDGSGEQERPKSDFKAIADKEVERIRLEGEIEKARVSARAGARHEELDAIEELGKDDPVEARERLSTWLNGNL